MRIGNYAINGTLVTAPSEEVWQTVVTGDSLSGDERRSPYQILEWRKRVGGPCHLAWFDYDNQQLDSLTTRSPGELLDWVTYTNVICKSVSMRHVQGVGNEIVAVFQVYVG